MSIMVLPLLSLGMWKISSPSLFRTLRNSLMYLNAYRGFMC